MKKTFLIAALLLMAIGSWSFTLARIQSREYMELILTSSASGDGNITIIFPDGRVDKTEFHEFDGAHARGRAIVKLNKLIQEGWQVAKRDGNDSSGGVISVTYLLEKN